MNILDAVKNKILVADGATGTLLTQLGKPQEVCAESLNIDNPSMIEEVARIYFNAGSNIIETNAFGANEYKLQKHGYGPEMVELFNKAAAEIIRKVVKDKAFVAGGFGSTGLIVEEEGGNGTFNDIYNAYKKQISALIKGGVDFILIETQYSIYEATAGIKAAKDLCNLPVAVTFSFEYGKRGFKTMMGLNIEKAVKKSIKAGADIVGTNCGNGIDNMIEIVKEMRQFTDKPILVKSNAGLPVFENGKTLYKETPEYMASKVLDLIYAGANIIGGCCGTNDKHIKAMAEVINKYNSEL